MKRPALFVTLTLVFFVWTFPHQLVVERSVRKALATVGVHSSVQGVELRWPKIARMSISPPGYLLHGIRLSRGADHMMISNLYLGFGIRGGVDIESDACGGSWRGKMQRGRRFELTFTGARPERCLTLDGTQLEGRFGGALVLRGVGRGKADGPLGPAAREGKVTIEGRDVGWAGRQGGGIDLEATITETSIVLDGSSATGEGLQWRLPKTRIQRLGGAIVVEGKLEVRRSSDELRAKLIAGLLPEVAEDAGGWRRYRVSGPLARPTLSPWR